MKDDSWVEPVFWLSYAATACFSFGVLITKLGPLALLASVIWPAFWLAYLGYWVTS